MPGPEGLTKHKYHLRKPRPACSALQGICPKEERDALVQGKPFICGRRSPATLGQGEALLPAGMYWDTEESSSP